ncbi:hypothetical protein MKW94_021208, partial [Papaver nudicaule]|nr:hypothetical protein [Papaver nudicaule]
KVKVPSTHCDERVQTICGDVMNIGRNKIRELSPQGEGFSVILSDMCPSVSGITTRDAALSVELGARAVELAVGEDPLATNDGEDANCSNGNDDVEGVLRPGGNLVIKLLESEDIKELGDFCKPRFKKASWLRPKATRATSREIYLICQGLKETSSKK